MSAINCPFCFDVMGRSDNVRRHITAKHTLETVVNKMFAHSNNYFYRLPDDSRNIVVCCKFGLDDRPETKSKQNLMYCFDCHQMKERVYAKAFIGVCQEHVCKEKQKRAPKTTKLSVAGGAGAASPAPAPVLAPVVSVRGDPYEAMLSDMLENPRFSRVRDTISSFYSEAEDDDTPATSGIDFLLDLLKFVGTSQKALQQAQTKAEERFAAER